MAIRVLLVDDHRLVREALRNSLAREPDIEVVGEAGDAAAAFECVRRLAPDLVVLDIGLPGPDGIEVARTLKQDHAHVKIVALSFHTDQRFVAEMLRAGADAYVTKSSAGTELVHAIRAAAGGRTYTCPEVAASLVTAVRNGPEVDGAPRLTGRERAVVELVVNGVRSPQIARELGIRPGTVEVHRRNIMRKLSLRTVADLTRYAIRQGWIEG